MVNTKTIVALTLAVALGACASSGTKVDASQMSQFHKGTTTYSQVVSKLGSPSQTGTDSDGNKVITYTYTRAVAKAQSYIPVVNLFDSKNNVDTSTATFTFNKNDVLTKMQQTQGNQDVDAGVLN